MKDISKNLIDYRTQINDFLSKLNEEFFYIKVSVERVLNSKLLLIEEVNDDIIGVCGLSKWYGLYKSYFLFRKDAQGKGLGKQGSLALNKIAIENYNMIVGVVNKDNSAMLNVYLNTGYRIIGKRNHLIYLIAPLNYKGQIGYFLLKIIFPIVDKVFSVINRNKEWKPEV